MGSYPRDDREVLESPLVQGVDEETVYSFDFTNCGVTTIEGTPWMVAMRDGEDVTADVISGTPTADGLVVTAPELKNLVAGGVYRVSCFVPHDGGQKRELYCRFFAKA